MFPLIAVHCINTFRFITNLDCRAILVLARTAPRAQARALRDSIYNHLAFNASTLVTISVSEKPEAYSATKV